MKYAMKLGALGAMLAWMAASTGCIVTEHPDNYYDRDHHRYWHEHGWHDCAEHGEICR